MAYPQQILTGYVDPLALLCGWMPIDSRRGNDESGEF